MARTGKQLHGSWLRELSPLRMIQIRTANGNTTRQKESIALIVSMLGLDIIVGLAMFLETRVSIVLVLN